ncbi:MAG: PPC domain-containing protein [Planctomycetia bacterium]|nr:PPC domain-containing protein [Planctomycetia bacterium]
MSLLDRQHCLVTCLIFSLIGLTSKQLIAQTPNPEFTHALPMAVQRGATTEVTVFTYPGQKKGFDGAFAILFQGEGLKAEIIPRGEKESVDQLKLKVAVDSTATLGVHEFRVAAASGASTCGQLLVIDGPVVTEQTEPHADREKAQTVQIGQTISGMLTAKEQVDVYKITAAAGQSVTFAMHCFRFFYKRHNQFDQLDPIVVISDATGRELSSNDDFHFADSLVNYKFEQAGDFFITVRDIDFNGTASFAYVLQTTDRPFITAAFPLVVSPSGPMTFQVAGFNIANPAAELVANSLLNPAPFGRHSVQLSPGVPAFNPVFVEVTDLPLVADVEPNDKLDQHQVVSFPQGINGRMDQPNDVDSYALTLRAGQAVRCEVKARRIGSSLDSTIRVLNAQGGVLAANDDIHPSTKDSLLVFTAPADGVYTLQIRDLLYRGGPSFGYFLSVKPDLPDFTVQCDEDRAGLGPGTNMPWYVKVTKSGGFNAPVEFRIEGLPAGVTVNPLTIPAHAADGVLILQAAADAKPIASFVKVFAKATITGPDGQPRVIEKLVEPLTEMEMPGGGRMIWPVETHIVSVCSNFDITTVKVMPTEITLKPGEKATIEVEITRRETYKDRLTLDVMLQHLGQVFGTSLPPGIKLVEAGSKTSLDATETKGRVILEAAVDAKPFDRVPISINANVSISFTQKRPYASPPIWLTVKP